MAHERPDLQEQAATLVRQLASYTITLTELEDNLLRRLAASQVQLGSALAGLVLVLLHSCMSCQRWDLLVAKARAC